MKDYIAPTVRHDVAVLVSGWLLTLVGAATLAGGVWLAALRGTPFYIVIGAGLLATGVLLIRRHPLTRWVYAALLAIVLLWALSEIGLDWWALVPRGALLTLIGLWLLLPWFGGARPEDTMASTRNGWRGGSGALAVVIAAIAVVAVVSLRNDSSVIEGKLGDGRFALAGAEPVAGNDWRFYGGDRYGRRYSSLQDVNPGNVAGLEVAWTYDTGDRKGSLDPGETTFEVTPIKVGDSLYLCTPHNHVIALDAATGKPRWTFDPKISIDASSEHLTCRGVSYHEHEGPAAADAPCRTRLIVPTMDARMFALDARTGKPCAGFGKDGSISLLANMPNPKPGFYMVTSPPVIAGNLAILGAAINDNVSANNPSGVVRAFDVHSGALVWSWDPGAVSPNAVLTAGQTYSAGAPNMWSVASADLALGLVYVPLGNKSPDTYGAGRSAEVERFSSSIVALEIATGKLRWVRQTVHHDLWDRDVPSQPTLVDLNVSGAAVPALVGPTKQGDVYVLNRRTGAPILPVKEVAFAGKAIAGDWTSPTQPVSSLNFTPKPLREADMWGATPFDQLACRIAFRSRDYQGPYTPPSFRGSIVYPGNTGIFNWGGIAVDPERQVMVGAPLRLAFVSRLVKRADDTTRYVHRKGKAEFGEDFGGPYAEPVKPFVSILGLPCQAPPWGLLVGASLRDGNTLWQRRNGTTRDSFPIVPLPLKLGVPGLGGPMITAGGLFFYSGTLDNYLRAYDIKTGRQLWQGRLPAGGQATPMTYRAADGRQMIVVAAGGHGSFGTTIGDSVVAYALPAKPDER